jgi:dihydroneopterin aldolase
VTRPAITDAVSEGRVEILGLRVVARHGVLAEEQTRPQPFVLDITMNLDTSAAERSDDLDDTVDYASVARHVASLVERERWQLLERVAGRVCDEIMTDTRITKVVVRVAKPKAPLGLDAESVAVTVSRTREA